MVSLNGKSRSCVTKHISRKNKIKFLDFLEMLTNQKKPNKCKYFSQAVPITSCLLKPNCRMWTICALHSKMLCCLLWYDSAIFLRKNSLDNSGICLLFSLKYCGTMSFHLSYVSWMIACLHGPDNNKHAKLAGDAFLTQWRSPFLQF